MTVLLVHCHDAEHLGLTTTKGTQRVVWGGVVVVGCGADKMYGVRVCPCTPTVMQLITTDRRQPVPSARLSCWAPHNACCLRWQVPGVPFGGGAQSFPSPRRWVPRIWVRNNMRRCAWTTLLGKPDPFIHSTTILISGRRLVATKCPSPISEPTQGKDHGESVC